VANVEYIHQIAGPLRGVVFVDAGGLSEDSDFALGDFNLAAGLGLRLDLPIGPVRFEYGRNLTRDYGETTGTFHFSIGLAF
jgi:outer membrane protein insertion porin family